MAKQTYHAMKKEEVLQAFAVNPAQGLDSKDAAKRLAQDGWN